MTLQTYLHFRNTQHYLEKLSACQMKRIPKWKLKTDKYEIKFSSSDQKSEEKVSDFIIANKKSNPLD